MQRGLRNAGAAIVQQGGGGTRAGDGAGGGRGASSPSRAPQYYEQAGGGGASDSLDSLYDGASARNRGSAATSGGSITALTRKSQQEPFIGDYPSVVGFLFCTFFDDEKVWTAEYGGPRDCEVPIQGHVCESGYLTGTGPNYEYFVNSQVVSGDPNAPIAGAKIVIDGLVRHSDGAPMGRCTFEKQRDAGRLGYKGLATWRLSSCGDAAVKGGGGVPMTRPKQRRFSPEYKVMTDDDWGDMDVWLALQCSSPVFDRVGVDLRPLHFAALTTTDYLDKTQVIALTRGLCELAGPATFTQSMLDDWGDLHPNPSRSAKPKYISRIHCRHWLLLFNKIMNFKIGALSRRGRRRRRLCRRLACAACARA
jgi:hypothetical protein